METLLSFCIPTYNRKLYLSVTIEIILQQINKTANLGYIINICISDNNSNDGTDQMINELLKTQSVEIIYSKNRENIGFDLNILKVVSLSNAKYCWLFGSDDQLSPDALLKFLNKLKFSQQPELFLCSRIECNDKLQPLQKDDLLNSNKFNFDTSKPKELIEYFNSCKRLTGVFSFISGIIFLKSCWDRQKFNNDFIGLVYSHVYMVLSMIKFDKIKINVLPEHMIYCRLSDDIIKSKGFVSRILLDMNGYSKFANYFFYDQKIIYASFVSVVRKEHNIGTILYLKRQTNIKIWESEVVPRLKDLQYNKFIIGLISFSKLSEYFVRIVNFGIRKVIKN